MSSEADSGRNRRESFRMNDTLTFTIRQLDASTYEEINKDFDAYRLKHGLKSSLDNQKEIHQPELMRIKRKYPEVGDYLERLETQMAQLAQRLDDDLKISEGATQIIGQVNLSASGIRFQSSLALEQDEYLEMSMLLSTQKAHITVICQIVRVDSSESEEHIVSARFSNIHPDDEEAIIRHMAKVQQQRLQARREERDKK